MSDHDRDARAGGPADHRLATSAALAPDGPPAHDGTWRPAAAGHAVD
ncbi:hypothetical protein AB0C96_16795 [Streptomyces sp. NPDC048506]